LRQFKLVDKPVYYTQYLFVKEITVGAFDAKTHLSQLLDEVELGAVVTITRRGRPVAVIRQDQSLGRGAALEAVRGLRSLCPDRLSTEEITSLRDEGRDR
jgi:antitoxin (DNA-binding transcriptional repressor) of toxin-antitoxin stability system